MKVSLNWAQHYSNVDLKAIPKDVLLQKIGAQLGAIEEVIEWGPRFDKIVLVKVVSCEPHPNADKLHVCRVDDGGSTKDVERGEDGLVQVVCGAPNVRAGLLVAWLPPGSIVPSSLQKEPFVLGSRDLRGVVSNGMLASAAELGLSDDHDGILEIDPEDIGEALAKPGTPFSSLYGLDDIVIDCENKMFTHRPDCFGILGVARELAGITQQRFVSPDWYIQEPTFKKAHDVSVDVDVTTQLVPRFMAVAMQNISVGPSPMFMQAGLTRVGIRSINNVVDITNWIMHLTGQPLHAYDYDKVKSLCEGEVVLRARLSAKGEKVALLNGKTLELDDKTIVIATDKQAIGIAGVMGGAETEVDENTKNILIEAATFDMYSIRKTAMKYGLFTDAVTRFNKGQSPLQNDRVLAEAMRMVTEIAKGHQASNVIDYKDTTVVAMPAVSATADFVNLRLGSAMTVEEMHDLLENVECVAGQGFNESRSYLRAVGDIDDKLTRVGIKIAAKTPEGDYKLIIPAGSEDEYEKIVAWEIQPGTWTEYIGKKNVFLFKDPDTKVLRYEVKDDTEHEIVEICRSYAGEFFTSLESILSATEWYKPLLPLTKSNLSDSVDASFVSVTPPFWRRDLELPEDLVEEIGRLYGFDKLAVKLPLRSAEPAHKNAELELASNIRLILSAAGANELLTYSFVHGKLLETAGQDIEQAFHVRNAISPELQYYRMSLTPSLLDKVHMNIRAGHDQLALFEIGKAHHKVTAVAEGSVPDEYNLLAFVFAAKDEANYSAAYYQAKAYLEFLGNRLGLTFTYTPLNESDDPVTKPFVYGRAAYISVAGSDVLLGVVGEYRAPVRKALKLPACTAGFEIGTTELLKYAVAKKSYTPLARFPSSQQDMTFDTGIDMTYAKLATCVDEAASKQIAEHGYQYMLEAGAIFVPVAGERKRFTFHVTLNHPERTLTTDEVNTFLDDVSRYAADSCGAKRI